ncbi:MAG: type IX secretion system membrane protein PorP/SprF [Sphingobacteriales bacterium]|nr:MAG: type IX secretion system membrane protein PorP/SprF [Sphingobacteriales bacterium]
MNVTFKNLVTLKIVLVFVLFFALGNTSQAQQKAMYTQYMFNGMAINPAYMAVDEMAAITLLTRHQWVGFEGAPNTQTASFHTPYKTSNTFYGVILSRDNIGQVINETGGNLALSQRLRIGDVSWLALGVNAGVSRYQGAFTQINSESNKGNNFDPTFNDERGNRVNVGMGIMFFNKKYYFGISSPHFYYRNVSDPKSNYTPTAYRPHFMMQTGGIFKLDGDLKLRPSILVKYVDGSPIQFDLNTNLFIKDKYIFGTSYRYLDSFSVLASAFITETILFGYSYDIPNFSNKNSPYKGSHELTLQFRLPVKGRDPLACFF